MDLMPTGDWIEPADDVAEARRLTDRIKVAMEGTWQLIQEAYLTRAWAKLGYASWDTYCAEEFPTAKLRLPREEQREVVASLRESGMTLRAISSATGISAATAMRDARVVSNETPAAVEPDNAPQQTTVSDHTPMETVVPTVTTAPKRRPLPAAFDDATTDFGKAADRLQRLTDDDRFARNREQTHQRMPELLAALRTTTDVLAALDLSTAQATEEARRWWATSLRAVSQTLAGLADSLNNPERNTF